MAPPPREPTCCPAGSARPTCSTTRAAALAIPGAMITASHNPAKYNGIKLCREGARPVGADTGLAELRTMAESGVPAGRGAPGTAQSRDLLSGYAAHLKTLVDLSGIRPLTVAVDAGNGMAGHTVPEGVRGAAAQARAALLRARRHVPEPRGEPDRPEEPGRPAAGRRQLRPRTSGWPSTATPTGASWSTSGARSSRPQC